LPLPVEGVTLDDKLAVTRHLSAAGANIEELNTVRKQLSQIKGGGLARACGAGRLIALVISDVLGDPLDLIASGPTVVSDASADRALEVLERFAARDAGILQRVFDALAHVADQRPDPTHCQVTNQVIGNNAKAVSAAVLEARRLGYTAEGVSAAVSEGFAEEVGRHLADRAVVMRSAPGPNCLVSGGEPTVKLVAPAKRGMGGRNQQLVLAAAEHLHTALPMMAQVTGTMGILLLSGGTDGEDGPTDAAGAWVDQGIIDEARLAKLDPADYLARNDAYHWFEPLGALIKTGPTDTNVCDLRVVLVDRDER
jgi:glycerate-2-kinase